jgi:outer membrane protein assembly factor BamB
VHRSGIHLVAATTLALTLALSATGPAMARAPMAAAARFTVEPGSGPPTARVSAAGRGFAGGEQVAISFDTVHLADATAAGDGSFSVRIEIPRTAFPGRHEVEAEGQASGRSATARFLVRTDWYQGEFDAAHTVHNPYENVLAPWNVGRLLQAWASPVGFGTTYASPIVVGGRVFLGGTDHRMHAFDAHTGEELWAGPQQDSFFVDSAASAHGLVFASALYERLRAYDAATGHVVWSAPVCGGVRASPTVVGHVLYMACFDGTLYALDTDTGGVLWSAPGPCCVFDQSPAVDGGRVFQMRTAHTLTAYDAATGAELWRRPAFAVGTVAAAHGTLFYGYYPDVVALDEATGALRWRSPVFSFAASGSPAVADGMVFVTTSRLVALDAGTGAVVWTAPAASSWGPSVANGVVYASSLSGEWDAFDERDGSPLWSVTVPSCGGSCANAIPVVADGMLYLSGPDPFLRAFQVGP